MLCGLNQENPRLGRPWMVWCALAIILLAAPPAHAQSREALEKLVGGNTYDAHRRGSYREYVLDNLRRDEARIASVRLREQLHQAVMKQKHLDLSRYRSPAFAALADCVTLLAVFSKEPVSGAVSGNTLNWLFATDERISTFLDHLSDRDHLPGVLRHVETLASYDPARRDEFYNLILALAMVWDRPRAALHNQMGPAAVVAPPSVIELYDYFKDLYATKKAEIAYSDLSVSALMFVVDVPLTLDDLKWGRDNCSGSASSWGKKFFEINYDTGRLRSGTFSWPYGEYKLERIKKNGGICADQAYYATMTARANGIPALLFAGPGREGDHAWFAYMKNRGGWELEAGRYARGNYTTGVAVHPQTNQPMTDHELVFNCEKTLNSPRFREASQYVRLGQILYQMDEFDKAYECGEYAVGKVPLSLDAWNLLEKVLKNRKKNDELLRLLTNKTQAFRDHPDIVAAVRDEQAKILRDSGKSQAAQNLLRRTEAGMDSGRDDLASSLGLKQVQALLNDRNYTKARIKLEEMLGDQKKEGMKTLPLIQLYLDVTSKTGQAHEAVRFLRKYLDNMHRGFGLHPVYGPVFLELLQVAYRNDGDDRNAARVQERIERLRR